MYMRILKRLGGCLVASGVFTLVLGTVQSVHAQTDFAQALRDATILQGDETMVRYPNDTFYVAVNGSQETGVNYYSKGGYTLGNGSYVITSDGEPTDCAVSPAECRELLEDAAESGEPEPQANTSTRAGKRILMQRFRVALTTKRRPS